MQQFVSRVEKRCSSLFTSSEKMQQFVEKRCQQFHKLRKDMSAAVCLTS